MSRKERILGRIGKIGAEVLTSASSMRQELEALTAQQLERLAARLHLVRRAEYDALYELLEESKSAQAKLTARVAELERNLGVNSSLTRASGGKKSAAKSRAKAKAKSLRD